MSAGGTDEEGDLVSPVISQSNFLRSTSESINYDKIGGADFSAEHFVPAGSEDRLHTMAPWSVKAAGALLVLLLEPASSLDVQIVNVTCDESLPVTADVYLQCEGGGKCTFGEDASVYGSFHYNGLQLSGMDGDTPAYLSVDLYLMGVSFNLCEMHAISLCHDTMVADEGTANVCPGDGSFKYGITYQLPIAGPEFVTWMTTGWKGHGVLQLFATQDESRMIGDCYMNLKTSVTQQEKTLIGTPSAFISAFLVAGVVAALALLLCFCRCHARCCRKQDSSADKKNSFLLDKEDQETYFKRMEEERSYWSGTSKAKSKRTVRTESAASTTHESPPSVVRTVSDL